MKKSQYIIKQILPYVSPNIIKINEPCNIQHIKQLIDTLIGEIYVYYYDKSDNSRVDLTSKLGNSEFNIYNYPFEKIGIRTHIYTLKGTIPIHIKTYAIYDSLKDISLPQRFYMSGWVFFHKSTEYNNQKIFISDLDAHLSKILYGNEYEKYIANKYEENNFKVTLNGINKSYNDGGIDIIAENEKSIILVQCKNWSLSNKYKINQKDLRAFIGDCYIYIQKYKAIKKNFGFHFIVSHENILTKSAENFLNQNTFIKFKCIPFNQKA